MNLRYLWRSLSLVFVLWFALSPILCYASETTTTESAISNDSISLFSITDTEITSGYLETVTRLTTKKASDGEYLTSFVGTWQTYQPPYNYSYGVDFSNFYSEQSSYLSHQAYFRNSSGTPLIDEGDFFDLTFSGLRLKVTGNYSWSIVNVGGGSGNYSEYVDISDIDFVRLYFYYDSDMDVNEYIDITDAFTINSDNNTCGINLKSIEALSDIYVLRIAFYFNTPADDLDSSKTHNGFSGWNNFRYTSEYVNSTLSIDIVDENVGLLNGIIEWLRSIRDGIVGVKDGVTNVVNGITQLPSKLWTVMENGIKGLFVPSETDITAMKDKWDTLLSDRFGVVYESGALLIDIANSVQESSTRETITFPTVSYNFSGTDFTFGGYEVDVIPDGFEFLADILKGVIDIVCTLAFINAMRRKYDELMMR